MMSSLLLSQVIPFVHPAIAVGALAAGLIPIIVHLVNRRRHRRVRWAAMSFLLAARRRSAKRVWLEQWLLMLTRIAVVVLLGVALARPYFPASSLLALGTSRVHRIVLLDNSLSMNARADDGRSRFDLALDAAQNLVQSFPETDSVSLVTLADPAEAVIADAAYDRRVVRERLAAVAPTQRRGDLQGAVDHALDILKNSDAPPGSRTVYLLSDLPRHRWVGGTSDTETRAGAGPTAAVVAARQLADALEDSAADFHVIRVAPGDAPNVAVTRMATESPLIAVGLPVKFLVEVRNYSGETARGLTLQILRDGDIIRREPLPALEPGGAATAGVSTEFAIPGTRIIEARLLGATSDALPEDDTRRFSVEVRETIPVLLVDGRPGATLLAGQTGFLATALAPRAAGGPQGPHGGAAVDLTRALLVAPKVISEPEFPAEALDDYDVVALCNVPRLTAALWKQMEQFVDRGGGLLLFGGDLVDVDNYNRFGRAEGRSLLPAELKRPSAPSGEVGRAVRLDFEDLNHPIVREFAGHPDSGLFLARFDRYLPAEPDHGEAAVLRYTDGHPAILVSSFGKGRVVVYTSTANMDWNNLPGKGDFVSLMFNTVAYLSPRRGDHRNIEVGETVTETLTAVQQSLPVHVQTVAGNAAEARILPQADRLAASYGPVDRAGTVTLMVGSDAHRFAVNVPAVESDLAAVDGPELARALDRPVHFLADAARAAREPVAIKSTEFASFALYSVLVLLLVETWLAMWFGSRRAGG